jgi:acetyl-CoA acetyltransferase
MTAMRNRVAIAGVGYSQTGRKLPFSDDQLVAQAVTAALADAGLKPADVDGISTTGGVSMSIGALLGILPLNWFFTSSLYGPSFAETAVMAMDAVAAGSCHTALAIRVIRQPRAEDHPIAAITAGSSADGPVRVAGQQQWTAPFGGSLPAAFIGGLQMQRYMSEFRATEQDFARHAAVQRDHASRNPEALFREALSADEYSQSRYVSKPVRLLDCDYPVDSASAVIFTTPERARDFRKPAILVDSWAMSAVADIDMALLDDFTSNAIGHCSETLWSRTDLRPSDVDCAGLYDGFSIITFQWLDGLGFCGRGEAPGFIAEGHTGPGGSLPTNTDGGACNVGRRHGANFCIESVRQLRGECGERQVPGAEVAVWSNATGSFAGASLLTIDR